MQSLEACDDGRDLKNSPPLGESRRRAHRLAGEPASITKRGLDGPLI
jgi:hypothetical protein